METVPLGKYDWLLLLDSQSHVLMFLEIIYACTVSQTQIHIDWRRVLQSFYMDHIGKDAMELPWKIICLCFILKYSDGAGRGHPRVQLQ